VPRTTAPGNTPGNLPATLRWAIWLLLVEAVAILVIVAFQVHDTYDQTEMSLAHEARGAAGPVGYAVVLVLLAWQLRARRAWARGAAIVTQLLLLPIGYTILSGGAPVIGIPMIVIGLAGAGLLLARSSREALGIH
jgi:hypothetical protein